jgi:hypothetical protein
MIRISKFPVLWYFESFNFKRAKHKFSSNLFIGSYSRVKMSLSIAAWSNNKIIVLWSNNKIIVLWSNNKIIVL